MSDFSRSALGRKRREYMYRKGLELRLAQVKARKQKVAQCISEEKPLPSDVQNIANSMALSIGWTDDGPAVAAMLGADPAGAPSDIDDEYRQAGVEDPKIFLTTSHSPSSRLKMFAKEMKLIFPNCERMNRGNFDLKSLLSSAKVNGFTDVIILHETRGRPDHLVVCHLPSGPTAYFTLQDVKLRHDIQDVGTMSEAFPHLVFENFKTILGKRIQSILKYLFPVPKADSKRMMMFVNHSDWVLFRHYVEKKGDTGKVDGVTEVGPQFSMRCHKIIRGTLEQEKAADIEYVMRPYLNTASKRLELGPALPWDEDDQEAAPVRNKDYDIAK